jgi:hypothetical protein
MDNNVKQLGEKAVGDMYLAAAMLSYGASLKRVDRDDPRRQKFIFQETILPSIIVSSDDILVMPLHNAKLEDVETYFIGKRLWFPQSYPDCIRNIKSAIHA